MQPTLTTQDLMLIVDANKAKLKSATVQGSDTESREWRAHLRGINQAIREGKYTELRRVDWEEIYYSLDSHGDPGKVIEKIGVDGCNMYEHARPTVNAPSQAILKLTKVSDLHYGVTNAKGEHVASISLAHVNFASEVERIFE